jgi:hypothetical protein
MGAAREQKARLVGQDRPTSRENVPRVARLTILVHKPKIVTCLGSHAISSKRGRPPRPCQCASFEGCGNEVRESLAGRAHVDVLHTLSVHELVEGGAIDGHSPLEPMLRGGWPELYVDRDLDPSRVLDDFILTYIEKDVVQAAGIEKRGAFLQLLRLLAGRTAQLQNHADLATKIGVQVSTVSGWADVLERMLVLRRLPPWASNLEKRLTKSPKVYFLDVGLAARLQGWRSLDPLLDSPQAGALFESLVFGEFKVSARSPCRGGAASSSQRFAACISCPWAVSVAPSRTIRSRFPSPSSMTCFASSQRAREDASTRDDIAALAFESECLPHRVLRGLNAVVGF